jgi:hypothetical protein
MDGVVDHFNPERHRIGLSHPLRSDATFYVLRIIPKILAHQNISHKNEATTHGPSIDTISLQSHVSF